MKLSDIKNAYFVGIKGSGMSSVAQILVAHGVYVSGSDTKEKFFTDESLKRSGIPYHEDFLADHILGSEDVVVYSTAYHPESHVELLAAKDKNIPVMSYPEFLGMLTREKFSIAVCGSHGKTTTTALLAHTLQIAGSDPSAVVGSRVLNWGGGGLDGKGIYFIFEADEYQNKFKEYNPWSVILTNIDWDHPDFFSTAEIYRETFRSFFEKLPAHGFLVVCGDDAEAVMAAKKSGKRFVTYGFANDAEYHIEQRPVVHRQQETSDKKKETVTMQSFSVQCGGKNLGVFETTLTGKHNIQNATGVVAMCHLLKIDMVIVAEGIKTFQGTSRRFESVGERGGVLLFDDYAHHPSEIRALLNGVRARYPHKRILAVFQPHTFSRTKALFEEFSQCLSVADKVYLLNIYASAREQAGDVSSQELVDRINYYDHGRAEFAGDINGAVDILQKEMRNNDIVLTIGAGDVWRVNEKLKATSGK